MSKEIEENTKKFFLANEESLIKGYCYLNTSTGQYFFLLKEIKETERVSHLVRMKTLDMGRYIHKGETE